MSRGKEKERRMRGRESSEISTHHSPVSVSGMMDFSFHDVLQTEILWDKISTRQLIHKKRKGERGEGKEKGVREGGGRVGGTGRRRVEEKRGRERGRKGG